MSSPEPEPEPVSERQWLTPLDSEPTEKRVNAFDVETTGETNEFLMGSIVGDSTIRGAPEVYWSVEEMMDALTSKRFRSGLTYAHNLEFDALSLLECGGREWLEANGYDVEIFHNGSALIYVRIRDSSEHVWEWRDSLNVATGMSVEGMGEIIELPKLTHLIDFETQDATDIAKADLEAYNIRDSKICYRFMSWLQGELINLGGNLEITAAKTALNLFRRKFLEEPIEQPRRDLVQKAYDGYYGGRVSPVVKGHIEGPIYEYDVASLYPYCMTEATFPNTNALRYDAGRGRYNHTEQLERVEATEGMSRVTVEAPEMHIPVLPTKWEDKLLFPTGTLTGWYCHNELRFALERGYRITEYHEGMWSDSSLEPFEDYVETMFDARLEYRKADNPTEWVVKLLMNSLYGKFGQKMDNDRAGVFTPLEEESIGDLVGSTVLGEWLIEPLDREEGDIASYINPLLASYVTAQGRIELFQWFEYAQAQGARVLYCDTDSVWVDKRLEGIEETKELGELDREHATEDQQHYDDLYVFGPKTYVAQAGDKHKITAKGIPYGQMETMWEAIQAGEDRVEFDKLASMREGLRSSDYDALDVIETHKTVDIAAESKRQHDRFTTHETMLTEEVETTAYNMNELAEQRARLEAALLERSRANEELTAFEAQTVGDAALEDAEALRDSTLTAEENKEALWASRRQEIR